MKKIVIASVLKPIDDVRSFWKLSQSMAKTNKYEVNIIGKASKKPINHPNIRFKAHNIQRTKWLKRLFIRKHILKQVLQTNPDLLIITTHELLSVALIIKMLTRAKVVYDVQENYVQNLLTINPSLLKQVYAFIIKIKEWVSRLFVDEYWLAEACYQQELAFVKNKNIILENKAFYHPMNRISSDTIHLLFSGTVSYYGGVHHAVNIYHELLKIVPETSLHIIGQIHDEKLRKWLHEQQKISPNITLTTSKDPIPYPDILAAINSANMSVIGYENNNANRNKIPTKLYEYTRYRLPYFVSEKSKWSEKGAQLGGAIPINFHEINPSEIIEKLKKAESLFPNNYPEQATWEYESLTLLNSLKRLI